MDVIYDDRRGDGAVVVEWFPIEAWDAIDRGEYVYDDFDLNDVLTFADKGDLVADPSRLTVEIPEEAVVMDGAYSTAFFVFPQK
jgi:hypothetical protein